MVPGDERILAFARVHKYSGHDLDLFLLEIAVALGKPRSCMRLVPTGKYIKLLSQI